MKKQILLLALVITALVGGISIWLKLTGPELGIQLSESVKSDLKTENHEKIFNFYLLALLRHDVRSTRQ